MGMPGPKKVSRYGVEFKLHAVAMSHALGVQVKDVADSLCVHPFMLSKWRKQVRHGVLVGRGLGGRRDLSARVRPVALPGADDGQVLAPNASIRPLMPTSTQVPEASLLSAYARKGAFTDCYKVAVPAAISLPQFIEAFYTTPLFKLERWILAMVLKISSTDEEAAHLAQSKAERFSAWKVEHRSEREILLDAGQTRSWLSVEPLHSDKPSTILLFGSAVVPMRGSGKFGLVFHALLGFHRVYSKLLLSAASRKAMKVHEQRNAV